LQQLNSLAPLLSPDTYRDTSDIAAWPCQARDDTGLDRSAEHSDDRNSCGRRFEIEGEIIGKANILTRELRQNVLVDLVVAERGFILTEAKVSEPCPNIDGHTALAGHS
jgi:hypothetical protein